MGEVNIVRSHNKNLLFLQQTYLSTFKKKRFKWKSLAFYFLVSSGNDVEEDDINTLIKRLEEILEVSDFQDEERKELDDLDEEDLELDMLRKLDPTKRW